MKNIIIGSAILGIVYIMTLAYFTTETEVNPIACPIYQYTGLQCAGCGSQRAILYLMNFEFSKAFFQNPLLFFMAPFVALGLVLSYSKNSEKYLSERYSRFFLSSKAGIVLLILIILWTIVRNI